MRKLKITEEIISNVFQLNKDGLHQREIAKKTGISQSSVGNILNPILKRKRYLEGKKYHQDNPNYRKNWYKNNKSKMHQYQNEHHKRKRDKDPKFKLLCSLRNRINDALNGINKSDTTVKLLGCTIDFLKEYLEKQFLEGMNWKNHTIDGWHVDHIKPCHIFDLTDSKQQQECFHYTNLRPLWAFDNLSRPKIKNNG